MFVQRSIADNFITALIAKAEAIRVGDPMAKETQMRALISARHLGKVFNYVEVGITEGVTIATGGRQLQPEGLENGYFMQPTILTNSKDNMRVGHEEIFGPVMSVLSFDYEDEAVQRANDNDFGLGAGIMTQKFSSRTPSGRLT